MNSFTAAGRYENKHYQIFDAWPLKKRTFTGFLRLAAGGKIAISRSGIAM